MSRCLDSGVYMMTFADKEVGVCYKYLPVMILKRKFILRTKGTIFPFHVVSALIFLYAICPMGRVHEDSVRGVGVLLISLTPAALFCLPAPPNDPVNTRQYQI